MTQEKTCIIISKNGMKLLNDIKYLLYKDIRLEWRTPIAINGILLYVAATVMIVYMSFFTMQPQLWNALFWIVMLFVSLNAVAKSFLLESRERNWYYFTLTSPQAIIVSKLIYNFILLLIVGLFTFAIYSIVLKNPVKHIDLFLLALLLGSTSFASCFTLISAIASHTSNGMAMMPILGFPLIIPIVALLIQISVAAFLPVADAHYWEKVISLVSINVIALILSWLLFPYLWQE